LPRPATCFRAGLHQRRLDHGGRQPAGAATKATQRLSARRFGNAHFQPGSAPTGSKSRPQLPRVAARRPWPITFVNCRGAGFTCAKRALAAPCDGPAWPRIPDRWFRPIRKPGNTHLEKLGISALKVNPDPVLIATEGALWGSVKAQRLSWPTPVIVSDECRAVQRRSARPVLGFHAERLIHKLDTFNR